MQHPTSADILRVREFLLDLQARICAALAVSYTHL